MRKARHRNRLDYLKIKISKRYIYERVMLKYLVNTHLLSLWIRLGYYILFHMRNKTSNLGSLTLIKRRCLLSGQARWVFRMFKLSRMMVKSAMSKGILVGVKKGQW